MVETGIIYSYTRMDSQNKFVPTADLCDEEESNGCIHFRTITLRDFGGRKRFFGPVVTVRCYEDNSYVSKVLDDAGNGRVLVVDGGGSCQRALFGDQLAAKAVKNKWAGLVINGAVRDTAQIAEMAIGVKAVGTCPRKSHKRNTGERDVVLEMFGATIKPDQFLVADEDGVVLLPSNSRL